MVRMGVAFSGGLPPADIVECVTLAGALGYESAWVAEGHGGDQFAILGACAVATRRIRLGTGISSVFVRSATTIGMAAATVDQLSRGRFHECFGKENDLYFDLGVSLSLALMDRLSARLVACSRAVRDQLRSRIPRRRFASSTTPSRYRRRPRPSIGTTACFASSWRRAWPRPSARRMPFAPWGCSRSGA
jgi:Luciferase-like monooxygenase